MEDYRNVRYLIAVAESGSFTAAALALGVSTSALSKAVTRLEQKLGAHLLDRSTRFVHLSEEGRRLVAGVHEAFETIDRALGDQRHASEAAGIVQISTVTGFGRSRLLPVLAEFLELHPQVDLKISFHDGQRGMSRAPFDVRITWGEKLEDDKVAYTLSDMCLILVASPAYLARRGVPMRPDDLARHDCLVMIFPSSTRPAWTLRAATGDAFVVAHPAGRVTVMDELTIVLDAARESLGVAVANGDAVAEDLAQGRLVRVLPEYEVSTGDAGRGVAVMQYRPRHQMSAACLAFVDFMMARFPTRSAPQPAQSARLAAASNGGGKRS